MIKEFLEYMYYNNCFECTKYYTECCRLSNKEIIEKRIAEVVIKGADCYNGTGYYNK